MFNTLAILRLYVDQDSYPATEKNSHCCLKLAVLS